MNLLSLRQTLYIDQHSTEPFMHPSPQPTLIPTPQAKRLSDRPVLAPGAVPGYGALFNPGLLHHDGRYLLFVRGIREGYTANMTGSGPRFLDYVSDVLLFVSGDGLSYRFDSVVLRAEGDVYAIEDPRVQIVRSDGVDHVVMTYTCLPPHGSGKPWQIGAHRLTPTVDGSSFVIDPDSAVILGPPNVPDKDALVFNLSDGRVAFMHRVHPDMQLAVFDTLDDLWGASAATWDEHLATLHDHVIIRPNESALGVGAGAPTLWTDEGLLLFFHERNAQGIYTMMVALLDSDTGRVRSMLPDPILVPELSWELFGDVDNVVFVQGVHRRDDGTIYLVYGAADSCVGACVIEELPLLDALLAAAR
jgi:beta-1,2-mannobiose phosphorylase / 1,2-beta-oligomannan phosphorylase